MSLIHDHELYVTDSGCEVCEQFVKDGTCCSCGDKYEDIDTHTCKTCLGMKCDCDCPPPVLEEKMDPFTQQVKVVIHESLDYMRGDVFDTLEQAIEEWDFGAPRIGAHHWDQKACHVSKCGDKWVLLYI